MRNGVFLTFEGIDGCGKSTQLKLLASRLRQSGREVVETVEPGGTQVGSSIRRILLDKALANLDPRTELLLYFASRAQNGAEVIRPALKRGATVLCDRFTDSTTVYQGAGRGMDSQTILQLHKIACDDLWPDLTLFLEIDLETSLHRARTRNREVANTETRMDNESHSFFEKVRRGFIGLAEAEPVRIRRIDAEGSVDEVAERVWEAVHDHV